MRQFNLLSNFNNVGARTWDSKEVDPNHGRKKQVHWQYKNSLGITEEGKMMNRFGNCDETYPFLQMLEQWSFGIRDNISGLSLVKRFLDDKDMYENLLVDETLRRKWVTIGEKGSKVWQYDIGHLWQPYINCRYLLRVAGIDNQVNFEPKTVILDVILDEPLNPPE
ncbi:hypothetical protein FVEN_g7831 [Fusarium venenatum]|nr:hypothetical protein FVEN_g7831 [Fusarium venenatum]